MDDAVTPAKPKPEPVWQVWGKDGFEVDAEPYHIDGRYEPGIEPSYPTYFTALMAAQLRLQQLDISQPHAGGQAGIQDRVYVRHPDGRMERVFS